MGTFLGQIYTESHEHKSETLAYCQLERVGHLCCTLTKDKDLTILLVGTISTIWMLVAPLFHCHALTVIAGESIVVEGIIHKGIATRQLQMTSVLFAIGLAV